MHKDWQNKTTVQGLVDGLSANASADAALKRDIEDVITRARQMERERCAVEADLWGFGSDAATAIRNLGDE